MIELVEGGFVPGDVIAYIPKNDGGMHPVLLHGKTIHICGDRLRGKSIASFELPHEPEAWMYIGNRFNTKDTYIPSIPVIDPDKIGTLVFTLVGESDYFVMGLELPKSSGISSFSNSNPIKSKFIEKSNCIDIIGGYLGNHFNKPTFTLQEPQCLSIYHYNAETGKIVAEQTFKKKTIFPSYPKLSGKQIAYDGYNFLTFEVADNKYKFLWPLEIRSLYQQEFNWQIEWDERSTIANLYDGESYHVIDLSRKLELISYPCDEIGFGLNSTLYETKNSGLKWVRRFLRDNIKTIKFYTLEDGKFEALEMFRTKQVGDVYLFGQDTENSFSVKVFIPNSKENVVKIIEFTDLLDPVFYTEFDGLTGELHLYSDHHHYKTAPLLDLI